MMEKNIVTIYNIPDLESGYSIPCTKEEYEKFMETWESLKPKWDEKWGIGQYGEPSIVSYVPMPGVDDNITSPKPTGSVFIIDMKNPMMEFTSNGTFQIGERTVYMIDNSPYDLYKESQGLLIQLDGKIAKLKSFEHDLMNRQNRPLVDKGQPTGLIVEFL